MTELRGSLAEQGQALYLGEDTPLQTVQRQRLAAQIGRVQGNHHLQRMMSQTLMTPPTTPSVIQRFTGR